MRFGLALLLFMVGCRNAETNLHLKHKGYLDSIGARVIVDKGQYDAFPTPVVNDDTILIFSKNAPFHEAAGYATIYRSLNAMTFDSIGVAAPELITNFSAGLFRKNHIVYSYSKNNMLIFRASLDGGRSFITTDTLQLPKGTAAYCYGQGKVLPGGRMLFSYYTADPTNQVKFCASDDGFKWRDYSTLYAGENERNETGFEVIGGTGNDSAVLVALVRSEWYYYADQFYSKDGGKSWTFYGQLKNFGLTRSKSPIALEHFKGKIYAFKGIRIPDNFHLSLVTGDVVSQDSIRWSAPKSLFHSFSLPEIGDLEFGYSMPFVFKDSLYIVSYDGSWKWEYEDDREQRKTCLFVIPVRSE